MDDFLKNLSALFHSLVPDGSLPGDPIDYFLEEVDVCFPKVEGPNFTSYLTHIPQDCNPHQCMITSQAASNLNVPSSFFPIGDHQIQYPLSLLPGWRVIVLAFKMCLISSFIFV